MRVALVTGAAGGIGSATVSRLSEQGYAVVGIDLEEAPESDTVAHVVGDVRDRYVLKGAVDFALARWGRLDAAVAAAAVIAGGQPLWETSDEELQTLWDVDVRGVWNTAVVAVPAMLAGPDPRGCRFVAVASSIGVFVEPGETATAVTPVATRSAASPFTRPTTACLTVL